MNHATRRASIKWTPSIRCEIKGYENSYIKSGLTLSMTIMNCTNLQSYAEIVGGLYSIILRNCVLCKGFSSSTKNREAMLCLYVNVYLFMACLRHALDNIEQGTN